MYSTAYALGKLIPFVWEFKVYCIELMHACLSAEEANIIFFKTFLSSSFLFEVAKYVLMLPPIGPSST